MAKIINLAIFTLLLPFIGLTDAVVFKLNPNAKLQQEMTGRSSEADTLGKLYTEYYSRQEGFFSESKDLAKAGEAASAACEKCKSLGDINMCIADCITKQVGSFQNLAENIADTVKTLFCKPLGMKMDKLFTPKEAKKAPIWRDFKNFASRLLKQQRAAVPLQNMVDSWISNVNLIDDSPMHVFSKIRTQIGDLFDESEINKANPNSFSSKCNSKDLTSGLLTLIEAGKQKPHVMDVLLRGLFSMRSSLFYGYGPTNQIGSFLEGLNTVVGTNCDLISYAMDNDASKCDTLGNTPRLDFPFPKDLLHLAPKCPEELTDAGY